MKTIGKIRTFNSLTGTGFISPEQGGAVIPFRQIDVTRAPGQEIEERQRVAYEVETDECGETHAVRLEIA